MAKTNAAVPVSFANLVALLSDPAAVASIPADTRKALAKALGSAPEPGITFTVDATHATLNVDFAQLLASGGHASQKGYTIVYATRCRKLGIKAPDGRDMMLHYTVRTVTNRKD